MLLSFAAGDTVGEATKWFHTYMMVNLGDPVAHVHHNAPGTEIDGLDRSIGTHIADSRRARILDFFEKDMNADGLRDVVVQYSDGYIQLILNQNGSFRSAGNIAYIPNLEDNRIQMADFQKDGFADIVALDADGKMVLLGNTHRRFAQQKITLSDGSEAPSHMQQMQVYDMDADGRDDLVYLTTRGELGILYGTDTVGTFEKKALDDSLGVVLREESDIYGGALLNQFVPQKVSL